MNIVNELSLFNLNVKVLGNGLMKIVIEHGLVHFNWHKLNTKTEMID